MLCHICNAQATGSCLACSQGLCPNCGKVVGSGLSCSGDCEPVAHGVVEARKATTASAGAQNELFESMKSLNAAYNKSCDLNLSALELFRQNQQRQREATDIAMADRRAHIVGRLIGWLLSAVGFGIGSAVSNDHGLRIAMATVCAISLSWLAVLLWQMGQSR